MQVKDTIRKLRKDNNFTQVDLADKLSCNRQKVADWERGKSTPSTDDLILLAKIFNTSTDHLLGLSGVVSLDPEINSIHEATGLSEKSIEILKDMRLADATYYYDMLNYLIEETGFIAYEDGSCQYQESVLLNLIQYCLFKLPTDKGTCIVSSEGDMIDAAECDESDIELVTDNRYPNSDEAGAYYIEKISKAKLVEAYKFERLTEMIKISKQKYLNQKGEQHGNHSKKE